MASYNGPSGIDAALASLDRVRDNMRTSGPRRVSVVLPETEMTVLDELARHYGLSLADVASTLLLGALVDTGNAVLSATDVSYDSILDARQRLDRSRVKRSRSDGDTVPYCSPDRAMLAREMQADQDRATGIKVRK